MNHRAFTLVELLVVVALIGLLVGLFLPALFRAMGEGKGVQCVNNLRQMAIAARHYAMDHDGYLPPAYELNRADGVDYEWDITVVDGQAEPGLLWQGQGDARIQQCPAFSGRSNSSSPYSGYNYNASYLGGYRLIKSDGGVAREERSARLDFIHNASECALFGDGEYAHGANKFMRSPSPGPLDLGGSVTKGGTQGFRHNGKTHIAFVDGHVEVRDAGYPSRGASADSELHYGFLSPDNSLYDYE